MDIKLLKPDGTNTTPAGDAATRGIYVRPCDGTNATPAGDTAARAGFIKNARDLITVTYDAGVFTYTGTNTNFDTLVLKTGGIAGSTVGTLTQTIDASDRITNFAFTLP